MRPLPLASPHSENDHHAFNLEAKSLLVRGARRR